MAIGDPQPRGWSRTPSHRAAVKGKKHAKKMVSRKRRLEEAPLLDECQECDGTGEAQKTCDSCGKGLTDLNVHPESEESCCRDCWSEDEGQEVSRGRSE